MGRSGNGTFLLCRSGTHIDQFDGCMELFYSVSQKLLYIYQFHEKIFKTACAGRGAHAAGRGAHAAGRGVHAAAMACMPRSVADMPRAVARMPHLGYY